MPGMPVDILQGTRLLLTALKYGAQDVSNAKVESSCPWPLCSTLRLTRPGREREVNGIWKQKDLESYPKWACRPGEKIL